MDETSLEVEELEATRRLFLDGTCQLILAIDDLVQALEDGDCEAVQRAVAVARRVADDWRPEQCELDAVQGHVWLPRELFERVVAEVHWLETDSANIGDLNAAGEARELVAECKRLARQPRPS